MDDLLLLLSKAQLQDSACLVIALLSILGILISWRKAQLKAKVTWCGWTFHCDQENVHLTTEKLAQLRQQLLDLQQSKKMLRKKLESSLGLLMWSTATCRRLRPYLAPLYRDLRSAKGTLKQIHAQQWLPFLDALNNEAIVARQPLGVWLPLRARVINIGSIQVQRKADIPKVPPEHKASWTRVADPRRTEIHLRDESRQAIAWLPACFSHDRIRSIRQKPALQCYAAADAMAKGETFGIGGWLITSSHCSWFSEQYCMSEARVLWPQLQDTAQRYIACF